ncbi:MAG: winged helix-turn-helix domain-containing protein [Euryarchaeota archaeon]|nr:winged helix-turn-helix domain-containing protein [Euryarchaeota archaeon]
MTAQPLPTTDAPSETESTPESGSGSESADRSVATATGIDELLALLSDEYACRILCALDDEPLSADDLVARCEMSRPTVYRRLEQLIDAGIVDAQPASSTDGHHKREFRRTLGGLSVRICEDGVDGTVHSTHTH